VTLAALLAVGACSGDDDDETVAPASTSTTTGEVTTTSTPVETSVTTVATTPDGRLIAPWVAEGRVAQKDVPAVILESWKVARNKSTCRLIVIADLGPEFAGATVTSDPIAQDQGWQYTYRKGPRVVEVIGLFPQQENPRPAMFSRQWDDGSTVRYGPETGDEPAEDVDPKTTANEAALRITGQTCEYRIYDTLGQTHLESVLNQVRLVEGN
jgi:hypothetical protein